MRPLSPDEREAVALRHPEAAPGEVEGRLDEYERLLADRFAQDPDLPLAPEAAGLVGDREERLLELHRLLFDLPDEG